MADKVESSVRTTEWKSIKSCYLCDGTGVQKSEELTDYHRGDYSTFYYKCTACDGLGRRLLTTVTTYVETWLGNRWISAKDVEEKYSSMEGLTIDDVYQISTSR